MEKTPVVNGAEEQEKICHSLRKALLTHTPLALIAAVAMAQGKFIASPATAAENLNAPNVTAVGKNINHAAVATVRAFSENVRLRFANRVKWIVQNATATEKSAALPAKTVM